MSSEYPFRVLNKEQKESLAKQVPELYALCQDFWRSPWGIETIKKSIGGEEIGIQPNRAMEVARTLAGGSEGSPRECSSKERQAGRKVNSNIS